MGGQIQRALSQKLYVGVGHEHKRPPMPWSPPKGSDALTARPPHAATIVQPKTPHAATIVQPKAPHAATVAQRRSAPFGLAARPPHAATLARSSPLNPRPPRLGALQRMNQPSPEKDGLPWSVEPPSKKHIAGKATKKDVDAERYSLVLDDVAKKDVTFINQELKMQRDDENHKLQIEVQRVDNALLITLPESHGSRVYSTHPPKKERGSGGTSQLFPVAGTGVVTNKDGFKLDDVLKAGKLVNSKELKGDIGEIVEKLRSGLDEGGEGKSDL